MKKIALFIAAIAMLATSCADKTGFTVTGELPSSDYDGQVVYLQQMGANAKERINVDTAYVENGKFFFEGAQTDGAVLRFITLGMPVDEIQKEVAFVLEPGKIQFKLDSVANITGTLANDQLQAFNTAMNKYALEDNMELFQKTLVDYVQPNIQNPIGEYYFETNAWLLNAAQLKQLLDAAKPTFQGSDFGKEIAARVQALEATAVGKQFTDLNAAGIDGKEIALSDYAGKGKVVLVDFWASWCGPCRREMPNLVAAYANYKAKGLEIVGVSLDEDKAAWDSATLALGMTWPQMNDLKGWKSELRKSYGVASIPHTVLIDKEGKIIARGLHGEELTAKIEQLFK